MRRAWIPWLVVFAVAIAIGGGAVAAVNATILGPGAFVRIYVDALARGDAEGALSLPGVTAAGDADILLDPAALSGLSDIRQVSDNEIGAGAHRIVMAWTSPHGSGETAFDVGPVGTRFGIFPEWGFRVSPVATVSLAIQHDQRFFANKLSASSVVASSAAAPYAVFVPGAYVFGHDTPYLTAKPVTVLADEVGATVETSVDVQAGPVFVAKLDEQVRSTLDACTTQAVLFPSGCPFGQSISDRVVSEPAWSIADYPAMAIVPGTDFGTWAVEPTPAVAHLVVDVQSLFDGTVDSYDRDVPFEVSYLITIDGTALTVRAT